MQCTLSLTLNGVRECAPCMHLLCIHSLMTAAAFPLTRSGRMMGMLFPLFLSIYLALFFRVPCKRLLMAATSPVDWHRCCASLAPSKLPVAGC